MSLSSHPGERLVDFVDGRLAAGDADGIRAHLDACGSCRAEVDALSTARRAVAALRADEPLPADLLASVTNALDAAVADEPPGTAPARRGPPPAIRVVLAVAAALMAAVWYWRPASPTAVLDLPTQAARDAGVAGSPTLPFGVEAVDAATIAEFFVRTEGPRVRVIDLSMMQIPLEGALRHELDGHGAALVSYRLPSGERLVCQMYEGRLADLPGADRVEEQHGFRFQVYQRGATALVFWQEGELVCVLAADRPAGDVLALAVAKAIAPTPPSGS